MDPVLRLQVRLRAGPGRRVGAGLGEGDLDEAQLIIS